jgi:hypothetical protein
MRIVHKKTRKDKSIVATHAQRKKTDAKIPRPSQYKEEMLLQVAKSPPEENGKPITPETKHADKCRNL